MPYVWLRPCSQKDLEDKKKTVVVHFFILYFRDMKAQFIKPLLEEEHFPPLVTLLTSSYICFYLFH